MSIKHYQAIKEFYIIQLSKPHYQLDFAQGET